MIPYKNCRDCMAILSRQEAAEAKGEHRTAEVHRRILEAHIKNSHATVTWKDGTKWMLR